MKIRIYAGLLVTVLSFLFICCDEDRVTSPDDGDDPPVKITRDNCIEMLEEAFKEMDIEKYGMLLLEPDTNNVFSDGYIWHNQDEDLMSGAVGQGYLNYYQDIEATENLFASAVEADLILYHGDWESLEVFREKSCGDCWNTIRLYDVHMHTDDGRHYLGSFYIRLVIGPDPEIEGSYLIYQADDLRRISALRSISTDVDEHSLGEIKNDFIIFPE